MQPLATTHFVGQVIWFQVHSQASQPIATWTTRPPTHWLTDSDGLSVNQGSPFRGTNFLYSNNYSGFWNFSTIKSKDQPEVPPGN